MERDDLRSPRSHSIIAVIIYFTATSVPSSASGRRLSLFLSDQREGE